MEQKNGSSSLRSDDWPAVTVWWVKGNDMKVGHAGMCDRCAGFFGDKAVIVRLLRRSRPTKKKMLNDDDDDSMDRNVYSSIKEVESRTKLIAPIKPITQ